ncbi:YbaB/EbfC family nucleoid-associated protein [Micromonospora sp. DH14]|uniref:YbaB/EbfC family nucleoid-associated protein n=1 Tax=Micromonospora sp. DH14 TaxID=3040120 RepID=UPI002440EE48|nr:YbaB/EbfC family nucleoid-associated protein [Micromonospora sp. DH14]MDG9677407.1 YbaB/EbfC family nucleoid-associated protein [Micromonospora sp. DH14]
MPALDRLTQTCALMDSYCAQMAVGVSTTLAAFLVGTAAAIGGAIAANASGPVSPAVKVAIFVAWAGFAVAVIGLLVGFALLVWQSAKSLGDANDALANKFADQAGKIDTRSVQLPGDGEVAGVYLSPQAIRDLDADALGNACVEAVREAQTRLAAVLGERLQEITGNDGVDQAVSLRQALDEFRDAAGRAS